MIYNICRLAYLATQFSKDVGAELFKMLQIGLVLKRAKCFKPASKIYNPPSLIDRTP